MKKKATPRAARSPRAKGRPADQDDVAGTYNAFKEFEGRRYTGMKIGRSHHWIYDPGDWKETKITPDQWQIEYVVTKRRKGRAPEGSGVPSAPATTGTSSRTRTSPSRTRTTTRPR